MKKILKKILNIYILIMIIFLSSGCQSSILSQLNQHLNTMVKTAKKLDSATLVQDDVPLDLTIAEKIMAVNNLRQDIYDIQLQIDERRDFFILHVEGIKVQTTLFNKNKEKLDPDGEIFINEQIKLIKENVVKLKETSGKIHSNLYNTKNMNIDNYDQTIATLQNIKEEIKIRDLIFDDLADTGVLILSFLNQQNNS